jgi:hypothetical protein
MRAVFLETWSARESLGKKGWRKAGEIMSSDAKRGYGSTLVLIMLGVLALYAGGRWLLALIPAAILVAYAAAGTALRRSRD